MCFVVACQNNVVDLVFVVDSSGSIRAGNANNPDGQDNWALLLAFINNIISRLSISSTLTRVGMVVYSGDVTHYFFMNNGTFINNRAAMQAAITQTA